MAASISLPKIGVKPWFSLRSKVASTPSTKLTPSFVAAHFQMAGEKSALDNIVRPLRALGLVEEDGSLTERGNKWRVDASYAEACEEILKDVYPSELAALTDESGGVDTGTVATWLMQRGQGDANAKAMAATYAMIAAKSLEPARAASSANGQPKKASRSSRGTKEAKSASAAATHQQPAPAAHTETGAGRTPTIHLDIQVHIPPAASAEQIDQIFASMAKHLYRQ